MKRLIKNLVFVLLCAVVFLAGSAAGYWSKFFVFSYKFDPVRLSDKKMKKDIHGGKTPEETYNLFVSSLKQGDLELASKYFILGEQGEKLEEFKKLKEKGEINKYIEDLPEWGEMREIENIVNDLREFQYKKFRDKDIKIIDKLTKKEEILKSGWYNTLIIFNLNTQTNIWKIERL